MLFHVHGGAAGDRARRRRVLEPSVQLVVRPVRHLSGRAARNLPGQLRHPTPYVLFRTAEGTKLFGAATHPFVAFEADYHDAELTYGWSVIVKGRAHVLSTNAEIGEAERAHLRPWTATQKLRYVRVNASEITGRRFKFGPEPDHAVVYD